MTVSPMLEARRLTKRFGDKIALDQLALMVSPGEIYCLLGANGAGKTTTISIFLNFISPDSGQAFVDGLNVSDAPVETNRKLAYIPEIVSLYRHLTGIENLRFFASLGGRTKLSRSELSDLLNRVGLTKNDAEKRVGTYSKGMRQKVGIAIALAKQAKALLLDEPTSGLDPQAANEFSQILTSMRDEGVAILMATHDLFRAKEIGDRIGIMRSGQLVETLQAQKTELAELEAIYLRICKMGMTI